MPQYESLLESYSVSVQRLTKKINTLKENKNYQKLFDNVTDEIFDVTLEREKYEEARDLIISAKKCMLEKLFTQEADLTAQYLNFGSELKGSDEYKKVDKELQQTRMLIKDTRYQLENYE